MHPAEVGLVGEDLEMRTALVTGGGSGIGLGCAQALAGGGFDVLICGRTEAKVRAAAEEHGMRWAVCDVTDESSVAAAVAAAEATGPLAACVANAGTGAAAPIVATPLEEWNAVLATNLTGAFLTIKHAGARMAHAGGGAIVAVSSIAGPLTHRYMAAYCASKAGLEMLVRTAADELGMANVRVNAVRPGLVPTELTTFLVGDEAIRGDYLAQMPLARTGTPEDVGALVGFLCSDAASWVTGQCIGVDGGHTLRRGPDLEAVARALYGDAAVEGRA
jgi:NAD(P)-dependent dehydrogenase (short-subunit alcohol dehydrogenase family)